MLSEPDVRHPSSNPVRVLLGLAAFAVVAALVGVVIGSTNMPLGRVWGGLTGADANAAAIVRGVRLPMVLLAGLVGALLSGSGAAVQGLLRNPLADPYLLGISGGAAVGVALTVVTRTDTAAGMTVAAFVGAVGAVALIYVVADSVRSQQAGDATTTLLLTGVVFNAMAGAVILVLHALLAPDRSHSLLLWMMGSLNSTSALAPALTAAALVVGALVLVPTGHALNALALGEEQARAVGVDPDRLRRTVFLTTSLMVGTAVAFSGLIGFVGLLVPHLVRIRWGGDYRLLIPASMLGGAGFLILADVVARGAFHVAESVLPVGAVTALIGAPTFIWLLRYSLRNR